MHVQGIHFCLILSQQLKTNLRWDLSFAILNWRGKDFLWRKSGGSCSISYVVRPSWNFCLLFPSPLTPSPLLYLTSFIMTMGYELYALQGDNKQHHLQKIQRNWLELGLEFLLELRSNFCHPHHPVLRLTEN